MPSTEVEVSPSQAGSLIIAQFPELSPIRVTTLGAGWDNTAYRVNDTWTFRFPRREIGARCLEAEIRVMPALAPRLPLPVPFPVYVGESTAGYAYRFVGHRWVDGVTACLAAPDDAARTALAEPLAAFLAALHGIDEEEARDLGAEPDNLRRLDVGFRSGRTGETLDELVRRGLLESASPWRAILRDTPAASPETPRCLVHGDLYARHLVLDPMGALAGVIDWGDVHVGHPAVDLAIAWLFLPARARKKFRAAYGPIPDDSWKLARFRAVYHSVITLGYAAEVDDASLLRETRAALERLLD